MSAAPNSSPLHSPIAQGQASSSHAANNVALAMPADLCALFPDLSVKSLEPLLSNTKPSLDQINEIHTEILSSLAKGSSDTNQSSHTPAEDLTRCFSAIDELINWVESQAPHKFGESRFKLKKSTFLNAIEQAPDTAAELAQHLMQLKWFKGQRAILLQTAKSVLEQQINAQYPGSSLSNQSVRRLTRTDLSALTQPEYIRHVANLFNLEEKIQPSQAQQFFASLSPDHIKQLAQQNITTVSFIGKPFNEVIYYLHQTIQVDSNSTDRTLRNFHPASQLLQLATGFVYHPKKDNAALIDPRSPISFKNMAVAFANQIYRALAHNNVKQFFEEAFIAQDPCLEATINNLVNFNSTVELFFPKPDWDLSQSDDLNLNNLLSWHQREWVKPYAADQGLHLDKFTPKSMESLLSSKNYAEYLLGKHSALNQQLAQDIPSEKLGDWPEQAVSQFVLDDLNFILSIAK
jgi:hypothetical protein